MSTARLSARIALLAAALALAALPSFGTIDFSKKEHKACTYCHVKMGSKDLNDVGKCYKKNKNSLAGCEAKDKDKDQGK